MCGKANWCGEEFHVHMRGGPWGPVGAVYVFARRDGYGRWQALYVGVTRCLDECLAEHDQWAEAAALGATHVHARAVRGNMRRRVLEAMLIKRLQPPLNLQGPSWPPHRPRD